MKKTYYQYIRGICILMVILIHTLYLTDNLYINYFNIAIRRIINFAVPIFVFLSGYFVRCNNYKTFYQKKFLRIVIPLLIWKLIYASIEIVLSKPNFIGILKNIIFGGFHLYYLIVLIMLFAITPLLIKFINKENSKIKLYFPLLITFIFNMLITIFYIKTNKSFPLYNYHIFGWFSYYYFGLLLNYKKLDIKKSKLFPYIYALSLLISLTEGFLIYKIFKIYDLAATQLAMCNYIYCIILCIFINLNDLKDIKENFVVKLGNYSYGIYLSHILIIQILSKLLSVFSLNYFFEIILKYILSIIIVYILNYIYYEKIKKVL